jgi:hypothetical protein
MSDPYQHVLAARLSVCEAFYYEGPDAALAAVGAASMTLAPYVIGGALMHHVVFDALQEVSDNIGLVRTFGQDAVQRVLAAGPEAFASFSNARAAA